MNLANIQSWYDFTGRTIVVTGGSGVLGGAMASALAGCGATVVILARDQARAETFAQSLSGVPGVVRVVPADVLDPASIKAAAETIARGLGPVDALINAAGGNRPDATTNPERRFFDLPPEALRAVTDLNLQGTILPCQVFGRQMAERGQGAILNVTSMAAVRPLTRVVGYSASKAAVVNFTQWLAVHMATEYNPAIRVNAVAPGFFLTDQNRFLLTDQQTGELTQRGQSILAHTPMRRFGQPGDLIGATLWLLSPAAAFVTGIVVPVDGGFSAFGGV